MATINFQLRNRADSKGYSHLRVCIQDRGDRRFLPLGIKLRAKDWDPVSQKVKSSHPKAGQLNNVLMLKMSDLQVNMATQSLAGGISLDRVAGRKVEKTRFSHFASLCMGAWEKTKSFETIRCYTSMLKKVKQFDSEIMVEDISPEWLAKYEIDCRKTCGDGGTLKRMAFISVILKEAIRLKKIDRDPFLVYKRPPKKNPPKIWLTTKELTTIEKLALSTRSEIIRNTSYWFLLSCYTGLRYSDIERFDAKKMVQEGRLILYTQKTDEIVSIKITSKIKELIKITSKLPKVYCNQKVNVYLKAVAHLAKIDKVLTFHSGRHTFGVQCANRGISQEVTAKLLGHTDLRTTAIYYKITNTRIDDEMKKWE